jgi:hypothetical protein
MADEREWWKAAERERTETRWADLHGALCVAYAAACDLGDTALRAAILRVTARAENRARFRGVDLTGAGG